MQRALKAGVMAGALAILPVPAAAEEHSVIVRYAQDASLDARARAAEAAGVVKRVGPVTGVRADVVTVKGDARQAAGRLNRSSAVVYAEPNYAMRALATPNDPLFGEQYALNNTGQAGGTLDADLDGPEGWDLGPTRAFTMTGGVKVGLVDTGVDSGHEDLAGKVVDCGAVNSASTVQAGQCADDNDHGTHVAGIVAANADNGRGVAGVAFNSSLSVCKALTGALATGTAAGVANCIGWLRARGARIVSLSIGGPASTTLRNAIAAAAQDTLILAAAGNAGNATLEYPAAYPEVVSVAATDRNDRRASFSNANADVEVAAPGVDVVSTVRGGYAAFSGTSMATPHAAGVAALIWGESPQLTAQAVRARLDAAVDDLGPAGRDESFGFGRLTLSRAVGRG